jgi:hypothetical protein
VVGVAAVMATAPGSDPQLEGKIDSIISNVTMRRDALM